MTNAGQKKDRAPSFAEVAKELGCDESEERFDAALKRVATHKPASDAPPASKAPKPKKPAK